MHRNVKRPAGTPNSVGWHVAMSVTSTPCGMCTTGIVTSRLRACWMNVLGAQISSSGAAAAIQASGHSPSSQCQQPMFTRRR